MKKPTYLTTVFKSAGNAIPWLMWNIGALLGSIYVLVNYSYNWWVIPIILAFLTIVDFKYYQEYREDLARYNDKNRK